MERAGRTRLQRFLIAGAWVVLLVAAPAPAAQPRHRPQQSAWKQVTRASWYGRQFRGQRTAGGTNFNPQHLTAAHRTLNFGSKVRVTELRSGRSVVVQITDRGPYLPGRGIDLSYAAARELGIVRRGVVQVRVELLNQDEPAASPPIVTASYGPATLWLPKAIVE